MADPVYDVQSYTACYCSYLSGHFPCNKSCKGYIGYARVLIWNGLDNNSQKVRSGAYIYRFETASSFLPTDSP